MPRLLTLVALAAFLAGTGAPASASAGTANPKLSGPMVAGGDVWNFVISADGQTVVYLGAGQVTVGVLELYSVPIDGSAAPVKLSGPTVAGHGIHSFRISPDDSRVVYRADQETAWHMELYSAPVDGSASPVKLSLDFRFCSIDGNLCETAADCPAEGSCFVGGEPCETNLDCPGALNTCQNPLVQSCDARGVVTSFVVDPTSTWVVYRANQETEDVFELYSVPIDGSSTAVKISGSVLSSATITKAGVDGSRAIYIADQETIDVRELYSVPIDGSNPPVKLNGELVPGGDVRSIAITPDRTTVVYVADQDTDELRELYVVPTDGSAAAEKLVAQLRISL